MIGSEPLRNTPVVRGIWWAAPVNLTTIVFVSIHIDEPDRPWLVITTLNFVSGDVADSRGNKIS